MKKIELSQGFFTYVDDEDYEHLMEWKWCAWVKKRKDGRIKNVYAARAEAYRKSCGKRTTRYNSMHGYLMQTPKGLHTDHILNGDEFDKQYPELKYSGLLNIKSNLRVVTPQQNQMNKKSHQGSSSKYKGVYWDKWAKKWKAYIQINGKQKHLGLFTSEEEAAEAYNKEAIKHFGEFALLNKIETPQGQLTFRL